ncbi:MAG: AraC family transcriptional regulator [Novosphingobium sp.]|nr:AraC family transcriptional regulator [Novosphingobium sp.]
MTVELSDLLFTLQPADVDIAVLDIGDGSGAALRSTRRVHMHYLLQGNVTLGMADETIELGTGDCALIARGIEYRLWRGGGGSPQKMERVRIDSRADRVPRIVTHARDTAASGLILSAQLGLEREDARTIDAGMPDIVTMRGAQIGLPTFENADKDIRSLPQNLETAGGRALAFGIIHLIYICIFKGFFHTYHAPETIEHRLKNRHIGVEAALRLIQRKPGRDWTVGSLAAEVGMSRSTFAMDFREMMGTTPMAYVSAIRLDRARRLLQTPPSLAVSEVANLMGYRSHSAFTRAYRQRFGKPPKQSAEEAG